jgi:hypothetical protein
MPRIGSAPLPGGSAGSAGSLPIGSTTHDALSSFDLQGTLEMQAAYTAGQQAKQNAYRNLLVRAYMMDEDSLRAALNSKNSAERLTAAYVIGERQLPWTGDLIDHLSDSNVMVSQAARRSLIILSYLVLLTDPENGSRKLIADFGPTNGADKADRAEAARKWAAWWDKHGGGGSKTGAILRTARDEAALEAEAARLSAALVFAPPERQDNALALYVKEKGVVYTEAIANALPQLQGNTQRAAREAFVERMSRMTADTLRDRLSDARGEMRRAALLAWASRDDRAAIPEIIPLLSDPDEIVIPAAKAALKSLTGQDFGPSRTATPAERTQAVAAWKQWWEKQEK